MSRTLGEAVFEILPDLGGFGVALSKGVDRSIAASGVGTAAGAGIGKRLAAGALGAGIVGIGVAKGLYEVGQSFEEMRKTIIVGTGASGKALEGLEESARKIGRTTPSSFEDVGTAVADLNTRLGLTGEPLEKMSSKILNLSRLTGTDLSQNIKDVTRVFGDWSISTEKQPAALDAVFEATKRTGISLGELTPKTVQFGAPLRQFGFSFDQSLALLGKWEKEGVNTTVVLAGLKQGLGRFSKDGKDPVRALKNTEKAIMDAGSAGKANAIAIKAFGQRAGPDMAAAVREGRFEIGDLVKGLQNSKGAIDDADKRTRTFSDAWQMFKNNGLADIQPLATKVFDSFTKLSTTALPKISNQLIGFIDGMEKGTGIGGDFVTALDGFATAGKAVASVIGLIPGPVGKLAIEAGLVALVLPRVTAGATAMGASFAGARTLAFGSGLSAVAARSQFAQASMAKLGAAAKQAAGVGGVLLLAQASKQTSKEMGTLSGAAGGALLGLSMGGPVGAAVGGLAGGLFGLEKSIHNSGDAFKLSSDDASAYAATLDQVTGAAKRGTRAAVLDKLTKSGAVQAGAAGGVSQRTLVDAAMGRPAAIKLITAAISGLNKEASKLGDTARHGAGTAALYGSEGAKRDLADVEKRQKAATASSKVLTGVLGPLAAGFRKTSADTRAAYLATAPLSTLLKGFPPAAITKVKAEGVVGTHAQVVSLTRAYNLNPKQIQTLAKLEGFSLTLGQAKTLKSGLNNVTGTYVPTVSVNDHASGKISFIGRLLAGLHNKNVTLTTTQLTIYKTQGSKNQSQIQKYTGKASGGLVYPGNIYEVGEHGRELLKLEGNGGRIIPNHRLRTPERSGVASTVGRGGGVDAETIAAAIASALTGTRMTLVLDDGTKLSAHVRAIADGSVNDARAVDLATIRRGGRP